MQYLENDLSAEEAFSTDEARHKYLHFYLTILHEISHAMDFKFFEVIPLFEKILVDTNQHGNQFYKVTQEENNLLRHKFIDIHWDRMADDEILEWAPKYPKELNYDTWIDKVFKPKKTAFVTDYARTNIMENFAELTSLISF